MARTADHPQFHYLESWLLPVLGLRASIFHYHPDHERDQDHYVDIGELHAGVPTSGSRRTTTWTWSSAPAATPNSSTSTS